MLAESNADSWQAAERRVSISNVTEVLCYHLLRRTFLLHRMLIAAL